jgi:hypothetical protein
LRRIRTHAAGGAGGAGFDRLIAHVVANTGWTWDQALDGLTLPRLVALQAEWRAHPPAHWLVAAALKYRPPKAEADSAAQQSTIAQLKAAFPAGRL